MQSGKPLGSFGLAAVAALGVACADSNAPQQPVAFDATGFETGLDAIDAVLTTQPWESFGALGPAFLLGQPALGSAMPARVAIIAETFRGSTFVYDGARYVADPQRSDAPSDGVRFVLYELNAGTGEPILDSEIATADVRDVGAALTNGFALDLAVAAPSGEVARYTASYEPPGAPPAASAASLDHDGVLLQGEVRGDVEVLSFAMTTGVVNGVTVTDLGLSLQNADLAIAGVLGQHSETDALEFDLSWTSGNSTLRLTGDRSKGTLEATVTSGGAAIATVAGDGSLAVSAAAGRDLSPAQTAALRRLAESVTVLLELVGHLVEPVELT
jgi:hypothetical protein